MGYLPLGLSTYENNDYGFPAVELQNWFAEPAPDRVDRPARLLPTPGLVSFASSLDGAIRGMDQRDGLLSDKMVVSAGAKVYTITSGGTVAEVGSGIGGTGKAHFAGSQADMVVAVGGSAYVVTGSLTAITVGASTGDIIDVATLGQRHIFAEADSGRLWYSDPGDPTTVSNTAFATSSDEADPLLGVEVWSDTVWALGTQSVRGYVQTGDVDAPFVPRPGALYSTGVIGNAAVIKADFGLYMVGDDGRVYRAAQGIEAISTPPIERLIEGVVTKSEIRLSAHNWAGHQQVGLHLPGVGDYFFDQLTGFWHRRKEIGNDRHLAHDFLNAHGVTYAGNRSTGTIYTLDRDVYTHDGDEVRRLAQVLFPVDDNSPQIKNLTIELQSGIGLVTGQGSDPQVMLRWSTNGRTWSNELLRSFGKIGEYDHRTFFGSLGRFHPPVGMIEVAVSDPVPATVTGLYANRSRV